MTEDEQDRAAVSLVQRTAALAPLLDPDPMDPPEPHAELRAMEQITIWFDQLTGREIDLVLTWAMAKYAPIRQMVRRV